MKDFINKLIEENWKKYQQETIGAGLGYAVTEDIKNQVKEFISENLPYKYNYEEYKNDTDNYVKYATQVNIIRIIINALEKFSNYYDTPKRFEHHYGPRD